MKNSNSPYSKMYLVSPGVYDKLLTCLDEKDKKSTEMLNIEKDKETFRPGEKIIEDITSGELEQENMEEMIPENIEEQTPEVFGENEPPEQTIEEGEVVDEFQTPPGEREIQPQIMDNPVQSPCYKSDDPTRVVKEQAYYQPNVVANNSKLSQQAASKIIKKYRTFKIPPKKVHVNPLFVSQMQPKKVLNPLFTPQQIRVEPQIQQIQKVREMEVIQPDISIQNKKQGKHQCPVCMKFFQRPWSLARHAGTVHKNLGSVATILAAKEQDPQPTPSTSTLTTKKPTRAPNTRQTRGQALIEHNKAILKKPRVGWKFVRDEDVPMMQDNFQSWIKPGKRSAAQAKLPTKPAVRFRTKEPEENDLIDFENWK